jgi:uncharacterized 2Fe-2S/4Fe-4S cluster protein (DUF4445 family)
MKLRLTSDEVIEVRDGENIYSALKRAGIYLTASCGGKGTCGKCRVRIIEGNYKALSHGKLNSSEKESGIVLACQTEPKENLLIEIPKESRLVVGDKIAISKTKEMAEYLKSYGVAINPTVRRIVLELPPANINDNISDLERLRRALDDKGLNGIRFSHDFILEMGEILRSSDWNVELVYVEGQGVPAEAIFLMPAESCMRRYGIAIDIGTTTVVVYLVNLITGDIVDIGSTYNSQMRHGDDVITRIVYATEGAEPEKNLSELQNAVVSDINTIVDSLIDRHKIQPCEIDAAAVAGNTTMSHIFWGLSPASIREEPYVPTVSFFPMWRGGTAKLSINAQSPVYTVPCVASYVGGDITAGILASKMHRNSETALFMDIGTNGEIAIGNNEWMMTAACSAGPCFEGSGIRCGMRATAGAIEAVKIDKNTFEPEITVIGGGAPVGICGSGMVDAISDMFLTGILDQKGKFIANKSNRVRSGEDGLEYVFFSGDSVHKDIVLTEVDIENIMRSKAAIYAGVTTLLSEAGFPVDAIEKVYIAGGFGNYLNIEKAIILGMLPDIAKERFVFIGNASISGAYLCLLSEELRREAEKIASMMTYIELSVSRSFMDEYMSALFLPHTDMEQFPTVAKLMGTA